MDNIKILISIPNHVSSEAIMKLQDLEGFSFEIDETQSYSVIDGQSGSADSEKHPFYHLTFKDYTEIIITGIKVVTDITNLVKTIWPFIKKDEKPKIKINNELLEINSNMTEEEVIKLARSKLEEVKSSRDLDAPPSK